MRAGCCVDGRGWDVQTGSWTERPGRWQQQRRLSSEGRSGGLALVVPTPLELGEPGRWLTGCQAENNNTLAWSNRGKEDVSVLHCSQDFTPEADSLECSEVQRGASESSSWVEGPPCAS